MKQSELDYKQETGLATLKEQLKTLKYILD